MDVRRMACADRGYGVPDGEQLAVLECEGVELFGAPAGTGRVVAGGDPGTGDPVFAVCADYYCDGVSVVGSAGAAGLLVGTAYGGKVSGEHLR